MLHLVANDLELDPAHQLVAPNHIRCQALSVLLATVASGDMTERTALEHHERLTEVKMCLLGDRVSRRTLGGWRESMGGIRRSTRSTSRCASCRPMP